MQRLTLAILVCLAVVTLAVKKTDKKEQSCVRLDESAAEANARDLCFRPRKDSGQLNFCRFKGPDGGNVPAGSANEKPPGQCTSIKVINVKELQCTGTVSSSCATPTGGLSLTDLTGSKFTEGNPMPDKDFDTDGDESSSEDMPDGKPKPGVGGKPGPGKKLKAKAQQITLSLGAGKGALKLWVLLFKDAGTLDWHGETTAISRGTFKVLLDIDGFTPQAATTHIAVTVAMLGRGNKKPSPKSGNREFTSNSGNDIFLGFSNAGSWVGGAKPMTLSSQGMPNPITYESGSVAASAASPAAATQTVILPVKTATGTAITFHRVDPIITTTECSGCDTVATTPVATSGGSNPAPTTTTAGSTTPTASRGTPVAPSSAAGVTPVFCIMLTTLLAFVAALF